MLMGAFWGVWGADAGGSWVVGILVGMGAGAVLALVYAYFAIHLRADQIVGGTAVNFLALGITGYFFFQLYHGNYVSQGVSTIPNITLPWISGLHFLGPAIGNLSLMIWMSFPGLHQAAVDAIRKAATGKQHTPLPAFDVVPFLLIMGGQFLNGFGIGMQDWFSAAGCESAHLAFDLTANHIERDKDGFIRAPDAPGLGMTVNVAGLKEYLVDAEIRVKGRVVYRTPDLD